MLRNHVIKALRNLWINKTFSILNLLCLTFGLACFTIVVLHLLPTFHYNRFHSNYNDLCVINAYDTTINGFQNPKALLPATLTNAIKEQLPEIKSIVRMANSGLSISDGNKSFAESGFYADNSLFKEFTFPVVKGDTSNWTTDTNSILLSEQLAKKIFESTDCIGKMLTIQRDNARELVKIKGIFKDVPYHSSLHFTFILPFSKYIQENNQAYKNGTISSIFWVLLKPNIQKNEVERKINSIFRQHESSMSFKLYLYPLKEMALYEYRNGKRNWIGNYLVLTSSIGLAILLIACFNFINLAIAQNIRRNREVGIKKVVGAKKSDIILQFLGETLIITLISMLIAIMIVELLRSGFNARFGDDIPLSLSNGTVLISLLAIVLFTTLVSGLLPAFYFASTNPLDVLKGRFNTSSFGSFRKGLVIFQFVIPILLIILTLFVKAQDSFLKRLDIGIDKDRLIVADYPADINIHAESFKSELQSFQRSRRSATQTVFRQRGVRLLRMM